MKDLAPVFAIENGTLDDLNEDEKLKESFSGKHLILLIEGRTKEIKGLFARPETQEEVERLIEALKEYKL